MRALGDRLEARAQAEARARAGVRPAAAVLLRCTQAATAAAAAMAPGRLTVVAAWLGGVPTLQSRWVWRRDERDPQRRCTH